MNNRYSKLYFCFILITVINVILSERTINIYIVSPSDDKFPFSLNQIKPAADMANEYIKRNKLLKHYKLQFTYLDSQCDPAAVFTAFLQQMHGDCTVNVNGLPKNNPGRFAAILGPVCSYAISGLSRLNSNLWNVPIVTVGAFGQPFRNRHLYYKYGDHGFKYITAAGYHYQDPAELIIQLLKKYNWKKFVYVSPLNLFDYYYDFRHCGLFSSTLEQLISPTDKNGFTIEMARKKLNDSSIKSSFLSTLLTEYKNYSIFVLCASPNDFKEIMKTAEENGFNNGEYVFINVDLFNKPENLRNPIKMINVSQDSIYRNVFIVTLKPITGESFFKFSRDAKKLALEKYNFTYDGKYVNSFVAAFYDSVILYARALDVVSNTSSADENIVYNASAITSAMKSMSFESISGNVTINENGDRNSEYILLDMDLSSGNFRSVATYNGITKEFNEEKEIDWGIKNQIPSDYPICGHDNEKCKIKNYLWHYILIGFVIVAVIGLIVIGVIIFRNAKFQAELRAMNWIISSDCLETLESRYRRISKKENLSVGSAAKDDKKLRKKKPKTSRSQNSSREFLFENFRINKFFYDKIAYPLANNHLDMESHHSNLSIDSIAGVQFNNINNCKLYGRIAVYKGTIVALKQIKSDKRVETTRELLLEVKKLKDLNYHHVCRFIGVTLDSVDQYIVYEYCCKGSLKDILAQNQLVLDWMFKYSLIQDICRGMIYIHNNIGPHGNLRSTKCVVDSRFVLKITGFGLKILSGNDKSNYSLKDEKFYASLLWTPPERLRDNSHLKIQTIKSDVYSFAIICQEIIYRKGPFYTEENENMSASEKISKVKSSTTVPFRPTIYATEGCTDEFVNIVIEAWCENPNYRPDFPTIKSALRKLNRSGDTGNILDNLLSRMEQYANNLEDLVTERTDQYLEEKRRAEALLYSMLPKSVAHQLIRKQKVIAESYEMVTVYFSDIVGFTSLSAESTPMEIVTLLNKLYTTFDSILEQFDVYKVETIGDAYVVCSGLPTPNENNHAREISRMSIAFLKELFTFVIPHRPDRQLKLRIGIHSGPVCAGVVGLKMPRYCLFGDTVNTSSRMESSGLPLKIHISSSTKNILCTFNSFIMTERGYIEMKGKGLQLTYWLHGENGNIVDPLNPGDIIISNLHVPSLIS